MKILLCLIAVIGVRARPQGPVVSEVTTVADNVEVNELTTNSGEEVKIENTDEIDMLEDKELKTTEPPAKTTASNDPPAETTARSVTAGLETKTEVEIEEEGSGQLKSDIASSSLATTLPVKTTPIPTAELLVKTNPRSETAPSAETTPTAVSDPVELTTPTATPTVDTTPTLDTTPTPDTTPRDTTLTPDTTPRDTTLTADTTPTVDTAPTADTTPTAETTAETTQPAVTTPTAATAPTAETTPYAVTTPAAVEISASEESIPASTTSPDDATNPDESISADTTTKLTEEIYTDEEEQIDILEEVIDNIVIDIKPPAPIIIEERKDVSLKITVDSDATASFKGNGAPLGLVCDAASEVDNDIKFQWTKNGRFIDTASSHVTFETMKNGNIIIYRPTTEDEGLYQCVASNSEGVAFSRVVKVRESKPRKSDTTKRGRALNSGNVSVYLPLDTSDKFGINDQDLHLVMGISPSE